MSICFFIAFVLGAFTEAATVRPVFASVAVARDARRGQRSLRATPVRATRVDLRSPRKWFRATTIRRIVAPLTGAAAPRAPAPAC